MKSAIICDNFNNLRKRIQIETSNGMRVTLSTLGAGIQNIALNEISDDSWHSICLSYDSDDALLSSGSYAGRTLAPNAGRIRNATLQIDGSALPLSANEGANQLHGGPSNLSLVDWELESLEHEPDCVKVSFCTTQKDGQDGYPGNRLYHARYTIEDTNWILIEYQAATDLPTYINMSNHTYWNLDALAEGAEGSALSQTLEIASNNVVLNDEDSLPADLISVSGTPFDFRTPVTLSHMLHSEVLQDDISRAQFKTGRGYNNAYVLSKNVLSKRIRGIRHEDGLKKACTLKDPRSGHQVILMTDAPALVLYSGGFLETPSSYLALEAQDLPDIGHLLPEKMVLTTKDHPFRRRIRFKIS